MAVSNKYARRRRNAVLAAVAMALVFIVIVIVIIASLASSGNKKPVAAFTPTPTINNGGFPTLPTPTPTADNSGDFTTTPPADTTTPTPDASAGTLMYVTGTTVNVRKAASATAEKISSLAKGSAVTAYEKVEGFYRVKLSDGKTGYISAEYLSTTDPKVSASPSTSPSATPDTSNGKKMYVTGDSVNVRKSASSSAEKVTSLNKGKEVTAYATSDGWTYIMYGTNKYGYISSKYLSESALPSASTNATLNPSATATTTTTPTLAPSPSATARVFSSFTELGVAEAVADIADTLLNDDGEFYIKTVRGRSGTNINSDANVYSYYKFATNDGGSFYIVFKGTEAAPTNINIQSTAP